MKKKFKLGVIGAGFMSTAIIKGALGANFLSPTQICVTDKSESAKEKIAKLNVTVTDASEVFDNSEFVLFAVKPQNFAELKADAENSSCKKFISIMAGVKKEKIKSIWENAGKTIAYLYFFDYMLVNCFVCVIKISSIIEGNSFEIIGILWWF